MSYYETPENRGFNFTNFKRNKYILEEAGANPPKYKKTGTTIVGVVCKDGVVLATDTRATGGSIVMEKLTQKLHYMAPNIYCAGAGTAADCDKVTEKMERELKLLRLNTGRQSRVSTVVTRLSNQLHRYMGYIGAYLIVGGSDCTGNYICEVSAHGFASYMNFVAMGSGSVAAIGILERDYKSGMTLEEGQELVTRAISAGIIEDLGSGSQVDVCVITKDSTKMTRNVLTIGQRETEKRDYTFTPNNIATLGEQTIDTKAQRESAHHNMPGHDHDSGAMEIEN